MKAAVNVVELPPVSNAVPPSNYSHSSAANPHLLNELTSSPPPAAAEAALNSRTPVSEGANPDMCTVPSAKWLPG